MVEMGYNSINYRARERVYGSTNGSMEGIEEIMRGR